MKPVTTDIDIDCAHRDQILDTMFSICAANAQVDNNLVKHNTGVYFQNIPFDPHTGLATMDYRVAPEYGYFKVDFLNLSVYDRVRDEAHLIELMEREPNWDLLLYTEFSDKLFQLSGHDYILKKFKPKSVDELAIVLALMRPAKKHLQKEPWHVIEPQIWDKVDDSQYQYKKSHAISYALVVVVDMNLLLETMMEDDTN